MIVMAVLSVWLIGLAFIYGYICGYNDTENGLNWGQGWDDGFKCGRETEKKLHLREELMKSFNTGGE